MRNTSKITTLENKFPLDINGIFAGSRILFAEDVDINREIR